MHVGSCALCLGPNILELIFHILALGSVILLILINSAFKVAFSSLIMSSKFCRWDCLHLVCFLCEMPFGLKLMPKASMSISKFSKFRAVCLKSTSLCSSISLTISGALLFDILWYLSHLPSRHN